MSRTTLLAGGIGGARMARGLAAVLDPEQLTVIGNVGDDDRIYGVHVAADLDTVMYTLAGIEGPHGWGVAGDSFGVMDALDTVGIDTRFRLGDRDLATCLVRTEAVDSGVPLSEITARLRRALGVVNRLLPVTDHELRTRLRTPDGWLSFQDYFVLRGHRDPVEAIEYTGAEASRPAPGVLEALEESERIVIAPSNPPLSIHPILSVPGIRDAVESHPKVVAVSPLFGGDAMKGPAAKVLASLGFGTGTDAVLAAYAGLLSHLIVDSGDSADTGTRGGVEVLSTDTRIIDLEAGARFAAWLLEAS